MQLESTFKVPVPVEVAWDTLLDYPRLARCMPGATVTGVSGDDVLGQVKVKLGPISITYQGKVTFTEKDRAARRVVAAAEGRRRGHRGERVHRPEHHRQARPVRPQRGRRGQRAAHRPVRRQPRA